MNTFNFTGKMKRNLLIWMVVGAAFIGLGAVTWGGGSHGDDHGHGDDHATEHHQEASEEAGTTTDLHLEEGGHEGNVHDADVHAEEHADAHAEDQQDEAHTDEAHGGDHDAHAGDVHSDDSHDAHGAAAHGDDHDAHAGHSATLKHDIVSNFWVMVMFFFWIAVAAMFFVAAHTAGWAGWQILIQKVSLAIMVLIPVFAVIGAVIFIVGHYEIFEWTHLYLFDETNPKYDALLATKEAFLNVKTFTIFSVLWVGLLTMLLVGWWKRMTNMDEKADIKYFSSERTWAAISIVLIAVINAFGIWHWIMSIEPHWYSTLFGWYNMASAAAAMFAFTILILLFLKSHGYLEQVNDNHFHDLGKYLFAISVFWTYLWFSQFMLIWYGNIPEETIYFSKRMGDNPIIFYAVFIINFLLPFFVLMKRVTKRNRGVLMFMCGVLIFGHWLDFYQMIVVPIVPVGKSILIALGSLILFTALALYVILTALTRVKTLDSSEHPYYKESLVHHI